MAQMKTLENVEWTGMVDFKIPGRLDSFFRDIIKFSKKSKNVCELGSGIGRIEYVLLKNMKKIPKITAVEYSNKHHQKAKEIFSRINGSEGIRFVKDDARKLSLKSSIFDLTFSSGLIEHFTDSSTLIKEHKRITKEGGIIIISVPAAETPDYFLKNLWLFDLEIKYLNREEFGRRMTFKELEGLMRLNNLNIVKLSYFGRPYRFPFSLARIMLRMAKKPGKISLNDIKSVLAVVFFMPLGILFSLFSNRGYGIYAVCKNRKNEAG